MFNKILTIFAIVVANSSFAQTSMDVAPLAFHGNHSPNFWVLSAESDSFTAAPNGPTTLIIYNKLTRENITAIPSDPIRVSCNNLPNIVHAGESQACTLRSGEIMIVSIES